MLEIEFSNQNSWNKIFLECQIQFTLQIFLVHGKHCHNSHHKRLVMGQLFFEGRTKLAVRYRCYEDNFFIVDLAFLLENNTTLAPLSFSWIFHLMIAYHEFALPLDAYRVSNSFRVCNNRFGGRWSLPNTPCIICYLPRILEIYTKGTHFLKILLDLAGWCIFRRSFHKDVKNAKFIKIKPCPSTWRFVWSKNQEGLKT